MYIAGNELCTSRLELVNGIIYTLEVWSDIKVWLLMKYMCYIYITRANRNMILSSHILMDQ